jgi:hypothetical protein
MNDRSPGRPAHIENALVTLRTVALTHQSMITMGELMEISHYVGRLERMIDALTYPRPSLWSRVRVALFGRVRITTTEDTSSDA